jgi:uncharacterized protein (TIGR03083 family)
MRQILTSHLFLPLQQELIALLRNLSTEDWQKPTIAGTWRVKDVVTHILDGDLRRLSLHRDQYTTAPPAAETYGELVQFLNSLNASWVTATERLSPQLLTGLLEWSAPQIADFFTSLPLDEKAFWSVAWAGEEESTNWMDIGRDYTEKWHHQAQIRDAVGVQGLLSREWLYPVFELAMYALPYAFRNTDAPNGSILHITIDGEAGGEWSLLRKDNQWHITEGAAPNPTAQASMNADTAWRLFFNGLKSDKAKQRIQTTGDATLCATFLTVRSVMV